MPQIDKEHLDEINNLREKLVTVVSESGQMSLQIELLESDLDELRKKMKEQSNKFKDLLNQEQILIKRLSDKYGAGSIDFETGEFISEEK